MAFIFKRTFQKKKTPSKLPQDKNAFKFSIRRFKATSTTDRGRFVTEQRMKIMGPPFVAIRNASTSVTYLF